MRSVAEVDLDAIAHNARVLARAAGGARLMAVVKADGYGHGAVRVAQAALAGGAESLAVATVVEAEELRAEEIRAPILIMGPLRSGEVKQAASVGAAITAWTPEAVRRASDHGVPIHLKIDSGMGRLGARSEDMGRLVEAAEAGDAPVAGVMSHFATADEREGDGARFFREQLLRFRSIRADLAPRFPQADFHVANSAATLREPGAAFDLVRCGIALYGCSPYGGDPFEHDLRPAMSLTSYLGSIKTVRSRDSVGYGRTFRASRGTRIGLVPVGYADGVSRSLGNAGEVLVGGRRVPIVGNVSMDQITVDLGPESADDVGDDVVIIGEQGGQRILVEEVARMRSTINYEVVCGVGSRVARSYLP